MLLKLCTEIAAFYGPLALQALRTSDAAHNPVFVSKWDTTSYWTQPPNWLMPVPSAGLQSLSDRYM